MNNFPQPYKPTAYYLGNAAASLNEGPKETQQNNNLAELLSRIYLVTLRYRFFILAFSLFTFCSVALYVFLVTPQYAAKALVKVDAFPSIFSEEDNSFERLNRGNQTEQLNTYLNLATSLPVIDQALSVNDTARFLKPYTGVTHQSETLSATRSLDGSYPYRNDLTLISAYRAMISAEVVKKTNLIRLTVKASDPIIATTLVNNHVQSFIDQLNSQRQSTVNQALEFLNKESEQLAAKVTEAERKLAAFAEQNGIVTVQKDEHIVTKKLGVLNQLLVEATEKRIKSETKLREARINKENNPDLAENNVIIELKNALRSAETDYATLAAKFTPEYPKMQEARAKVISLQEELNRQYDIALNSLDAEFKANAQTEKEISQQVELQKSKAFELARRLGPYKSLEREYDSLQKLYNSVLQKLKEGQIAAQNNLSSISLVEPAAVGVLVHPNISLAFLLTIVLAPSFAIFIAIVFDSMDNSIHTPEEAEGLLDIPTLGVIPLFSSENYATGNQLSLIEQGTLKTDDLPTKQASNKNLKSADCGNFFDSPIVMVSQQNLEAESFRSIRTAIMLSTVDRSMRTIAFTSAQKGEGKSTVTANLAVAFAQADMKVILIDADLRRPSLHTTMNVEANVPGLVNLLTGDKPLSSVITNSGIKNLDIITAGPVPPNPAELIGSSKMAQIVDGLKTKYDYVFIDTPPLLPVTDALLLAHICDGVILVIKGQETSRKLVARATNMLKQSRAKIAGLILNKLTEHGAYYHYYREAYRYYRNNAA
ncbi:MAG: polysaccharide biosynthesis tyrosine autokinase [Deltaproteobacteria bacterium]|nr:polysaccharide biosynthesis tyrosine autokinase [Deltaproteobacteria bacterium]